MNILDNFVSLFIFSIGFSIAFLLIFAYNHPRKVPFPQQYPNPPKPEDKNPKSDQIPKTPVNFLAELLNTTTDIYVSSSNDSMDVNFHDFQSKSSEFNDLITSINMIELPSNFNCCAHTPTSVFQDDENTFRFSIDNTFIPISDRNSKAKLIINHSIELNIQIKQIRIPFIVSGHFELDETKPSILDAQIIEIPSNDNEKAIFDLVLKFLEYHLSNSLAIGFNTYFYQQNSENISSEHPHSE